MRNLTAGPAGSGPQGFPSGVHSPSGSLADSEHASQLRVRRCTTADVGGLVFSEFDRERTSAHSDGGQKDVFKTAGTGVVAGLPTAACRTATPMANRGIRRHATALS